MKGYLKEEELKELESYIKEDLGSSEAEVQKRRKELLENWGEHPREYWEGHVKAVWGVDSLCKRLWYFNGKEPKFIKDLRDVASENIGLMRKDSIVFGFHLQEIRREKTKRSDLKEEEKKGIGYMSPEALEHCHEEFQELPGADEGLKKELEILGKHPREYWEGFVMGLGAACAPLDPIFERVANSLILWGKLRRKLRDEILETHIFLGILACYLLEIRKGHTQEAGIC